MVAAQLALYAVFRRGLATAESFVPQAVAQLPVGACAGPARQAQHPSGAGLVCRGRGRDNASGGVYGKVQYVDHFTLNGKTFTFDIGGGEEPQG